MAMSSLYLHKAPAAGKYGRYRRHVEETKASATSSGCTSCGFQKIWLAQFLKYQDS